MINIDFKDKMNITAAAHYLRVGYRIRRACWEPEEFLSELASLLDKREVLEHGVLDNQGYHKIRTVHDGTAFLILEDLLADDWEVVTTNIRKYFNKYDSLEYQDETDWDNCTIDSSYFED